MHIRQVPYKNFKNEPKTATVHFNLTEREVFKLLTELKAVFDWVESLSKETDLRTLDPVELVNFYNNFEEIFLSAYGVPSEDGEHFRKGGRYEFEESAIFAACMLEFLSEPKQTTEMLNDLLPNTLQEMVKRSDENLAELGKNAEGREAELLAEIAKLRGDVAPEV